MSLRPEKTSSSLSPFHLRKGSLRKHSFKLKSWFTKIISRASTSRQSPTNRLLPDTQDRFQLLTRLPLEIRRQIYAHVLDSFGTVQHVFLSDKKLTHMRCVSPTSHQIFQSYGERYRVCNSYDITYRKSVQNGWEIIPLLLSCRQIYLEFIEMIYSSTTFRFSVDPATRFITTVPASSTTLAHLHLSCSIDKPMYMPYGNWPVSFTVADSNPQAVEAEWEALWRAFGRLRLRALLVEIFDSGLRVPEQTLLEPLKNIRADQFEVVLPWPMGLESSGKFDGVAFVVRRPPEGTDVMTYINVDHGCLGPPESRGIWGRLRRR